MTKNKLNSVLTNRKVFLGTIGGLTTVLLISNFMWYGTSLKTNNKLASANNTISELERLNGNVKDINNVLDSDRRTLKEIKEKISKEENTLKEVNEWKNVKEAKNKDISDLDIIINNKKSELTKLDSEVGNLRDEKDKLTKEEETRQVEALTFKDGNYLVGKDIPEGVYDIHLVSGNGNVILSNGALNAIFGNRDRNVQEMQNIPFKKDTTLKLMGGVSVKLVLDPGYKIN